MALPAIRFYVYIAVTLITELLLVRMAMKTGVFQTHGEVLTAAVDIYGSILTHNFVPPIIEQLHVFINHVLFRFYAMLFFHLPDYRRIEAWVRFNECLSGIVPEWQRNDADKYKQSGDNFTAVIHVYHLPFLLQDRLSR